MAELRNRGLRDRQVAEKIGAGNRATVWRYAREVEDFPKPVKIGPGITIWLESEVDAWVAARAAERGGAA